MSWLRPCIAVVVAAVGALTYILPPGLGLAREKKSQFAQVIVHAGREGCTVELESRLMGKTDATGRLVLLEVEPGDHYLHVRCPGQEENAFFISPRAGKQLDIHQEESTGTAPSPVEPAEAKIQLRRHIQEAVRLRARGRFEESVEHLRNARRLDPDNSDLHRELGITFLLAKDWKRARVEMLEAIRHDPSDAEAQNGLGYALEKLGDFDAAVEAFRAAMRLEPEERSYRQHYFEALGKLAAQQAEKKK